MLRSDPTWSPHAIWFNRKSPPIKGTGPTWSPHGILSYMKHLLLRSSALTWNLHKIWYYVKHPPFMGTCPMNPSSPWDLVLNEVPSPIGSDSTCSPYHEILFYVKPAMRSRPHEALPVGSDPSWSTLPSWDLVLHKFLLSVGPVPTRGPLPHGIWSYMKPLPWYLVLCEALPMGSDPRWSPLPSSPGCSQCEVCVSPQHRWLLST